MQAAAADGGCLPVTGEVRYLSKDGQLGRVVELGPDLVPWPGHGCGEPELRRRTHHDVADRGARARHSDNHEHADPVDGAAALDSHAFDTMSIDPTFGEDPMSGSPPTSLRYGPTPVWSSGPRTVNDLVATTPKTLTEWTSVWRAHPGGRILTLTRLRQRDHRDHQQPAVVAYSDVGVRLWQFAGR